MKKIISLLFLSLFFIECNQDNEQNNGSHLIGIELQDLKTALAYGAGPIENTEFFKHSGIADSVYETQSGVVMVVPKGAFLDENGKTVTDEIVIELAEVKTLEDFMRAKLSEYKDILATESEKMLYINATSNGKQLSINEKSPIYLEFPTRNKSDLKVFKGVRNSNGNMQWLNPQKPANYLVPIDQDLIDYYPEGFELALKNMLPLNGHDSLCKEFVDSIFFALTPYCYQADSIIVISRIGDINDSVAFAEGRVHWDTISINRPDFNKDDFDPRENIAVEDPASESCPCIKTSNIKTIQDKQFAKSFLATREFEKRLKYIYKTGSQIILDAYTKNLSKNLYELDRFAADQLTKRADLKTAFEKFAEEKLTNVKDIENIAKHLSYFYNKKLRSIEKELNKRKKHQVDDHRTMMKDYEKKKKEYKKLLEKRLEYRMDKFGFHAKETGWYNVKGTQPHELPKFSLEIKIENGDSMDNVYTYFIQPQIKSLFAFSSDDKVRFNNHVGVDSILLSSIGWEVYVVSVAYKGKQGYYNEQKFRLDKENKVVFSLEKQSEDYIKHKLKESQRFHNKYNSIAADIEYRMQIEKTKKKEKEYRDKEQKMYNLLEFVDACESLK